MNHKCTRRLLRINLPVFSKPTADAGRIEQSEEFLLITHLRTRRISEGITTASIVLREEFTGTRRIISSDPEFGPHSLVPEFGEPFGTFDSESMEEEIFLILIVLEEPPSHLAQLGPHGDTMKTDDVPDPGVNGLEEVADAELVLFILSGKRETFGDALR